MTRTGVVAPALIALLAMACGQATEAPSPRTPVAAPASAIDTSTPEDWKANCAARYHYRNTLIFTATETVEDGRRVGVLSTARAPYVAAFASLKLDGVPGLKAKRDEILALADKAPGGGRIAIGPDLHKADRALWEDVVRLGGAHGVDCQALEK